VARLLLQSRAGIQEAAFSTIELASPATGDAFDDVEEVETARNGLTKFVFVDKAEFGEQFMSFTVKQAKDGVGDGVDTLMTTAGT
jgi:hypothetical protein